MGLFQLAAAANIRMLLSQYKTGSDPTRAILRAMWNWLISLYETGSVSTCRMEVSWRGMFFIPYQTGSISTHPGLCAQSSSFYPNAKLGLIPIRKFWLLLEDGCYPNTNWVCINLVSPQFTSRIRC